jgi:hypothetical protein
MGNLARIVVIQHRKEKLPLSTYLLHPLLQIWESWGHQVRVVHGTRGLPDADLAILHVDLSVIPAQYAAAVAHYPRVVNGRALDIRKRTVSRNLVRPGDDWDGMVIAKSDLNAAGFPEFRVLRGRRPRPRYMIYAGIAQVPDRVWADPRMVVERYLPELGDGCFQIRTFTFFGDGMRNRICRSPSPLIKGAEIVEHWPGPAVPQELLAERERLEIDYGKFDYVVRDGRAILFDANKTPSFPPGRPRAMFEDLAAGLQSMLA